MQQMMVSCYRFDEYSSHERGIRKGKSPASDTVCTKKPTDIRYMPCVLRANPEVYCIYVVRDPRDTVCSRLKTHPDAYYSNLGLWNRSDRIASRLHGHPRFIEVRYEDLVREPDQVQQVLEKKLPFLRRQAPFSRFHEYWRSDGTAEMAMNGLRPPDPSGPGRWREHIERVSRQVATHGDPTEALIRWGYEENGDWKQVLLDLPPAYDSVMPDRIPLRTRWVTAWKIFRRCLSYRLKLRRGKLGY